MFDPGERRKTRLAEGDEAFKVCCSCDQPLSVAEPASFSVDQGKKDGLNSQCKDCSNVRFQAFKRRKELEKADPKKAVLDEKIEEIERKKKAKAEARAIKKELARLEDTDDEEDGVRVLRKIWFTDPEKRLRSIKKALPEAIAQSDGQLAKMSVMLNLGISEIQTVIESDADLSAQYEQACNEAISKVESRLFEAAAGGSGPDVRFFLQHNNPEKYGSKTQVDVRNVGFAPPPAEGAPESVLHVVNGKADSCDGD